MFGPQPGLLELGREGGGVRGKGRKGGRKGEGGREGGE